MHSERESEPSRGCREQKVNSRDAPRHVRVAGRLSMRRHLLHVARGCAFSAVILGAVVGGACNPDFSTDRAATPASTLGDDMYSIMCDRVAASEHPEDLEARYSQRVCHIDANGAYADDYDQIDMPPRMAVMVRYRKDFIDAINAMFPDTKYSDTQSLHKDMQDLLKELVPLY